MAVFKHADCTRGIGVRPVSIVIALITCAALLTSCASGVMQSNVNIREPFHSEGFAHVHSGDTLALLLASNIGDGNVEYRKMLCDFVDEMIRAERPEVKAIPLWQTLSIVNVAGFSGEYATMLKDYASSGILDKETLRKLGAAMGVKYFLHPRLAYFSQNQNTRFSIFGVRFLTTFETQIKVYIELWNAETGEVAWIGAAEADLANEHYKAKPIPFEEAARIVIAELMRKMPTGNAAVEPGPTDIKSKTNLNTNTDTQSVE